MNETASTQSPRVIIFDDDRSFVNKTAREASVLGYQAVHFDKYNALQAAVSNAPKNYVSLVTELKNDSVDAFKLFDFVKPRAPHIKLIIVTAFGGVESAVAAIKRGFDHYFVKPIEFKMIHKVTEGVYNKEAGAEEINQEFMSADRVRREHIQRVYHVCGYNVSETARRLNMHRRTLQRILSKHTPK